MDTLTEFVLVKTLERSAELLKIMTLSFEDSTLGTNIKSFGTHQSPNLTATTNIASAPAEAGSTTSEEHNPFFPQM